MPWTQYALELGPLMVIATVVRPSGLVAMRERVNDYLPNEEVAKPRKVRVLKSITDVGLEGQ